MEIETGYGVEAILPDAKVANIIQQQITPRLKKGDFDGGTLAGTKALVVALQTNQPSSTSGAVAPTSNTTANSTSSTDQVSGEAGVPSWVYWLGGIGGGGVLGAIAYLLSLEKKLLFRAFSVCLMVLPSCLRRDSWV